MDHRNDPAGAPARTDREALHATESHFAAIVESTADAIVGMTVEGRILSWNAGAENLFGFAAEAAIGQDLSLITPPERAEELADMLRGAAIGRRMPPSDTTCLRGDGRRVDVSITMSPIRGSAGNVIGVSTIARDVSEYRRSEQRMTILYWLTDSIRNADESADVFDAALDALQRALHPERAAVLLVDETGRMRFKAWRVLSDAYRAAVEGHSPWTADEADTQPVLVPDTRTEPALPFRAAMDLEGIGSLAHIPLVHQGRLLGEVMICFDDPRSLAEKEVEVAQAIAGRVAFGLSRLKAEQELALARDQLDMITASSADGITIQDPSGKVIYANLAAARMSGYETVDAFVNSPAEERLEKWKLVDEEGRPFPPEHLPGRRALAGERDAEATICVRSRDDGREFWSHVRASPAFDVVGRVRYAINIFRDITQEKRPNEQLRLQRVLLEAQSEASVEGVLVVNRAGKMISWNQRFVEMWRIPEDVMASGSDEAAIGSVLDQLVEPDEFRERVAYLYEHPEVDAREEIALKDGRSFERYTRPFRDEGDLVRGRLWFFRDITQERRREQAQRVLAEAGELLAKSMDFERTIAEVAGLAVPRMAEWATVDLLEDDGSLRQLAVVHADPAKVQMAKELRRRRPLDPRSPTGIAKVVRSGVPELIPEIKDESLDATASGDEDREIVPGLHLTAAMIVPLTVRGRTLGAFTFARAETELSYSKQDLELALELGRRAATAIENARVYQERDYIAKTLQASLLPPELPDIPGVEAAARYRAAGRGYDVGGDFYDLFEAGEGQWTAAIGDVCGKGPAAAAMMGLVRHSIRAAAMRERRPSRVLTVVNEALLREEDEDRFCTVACARIRPNTGGVTVDLSCGGHPPPIVLRADGRAEPVPVAGSLLGIFPDPELEDREVELEPGDALVLYTDGITEERRGREIFGERSLLEILARCRGESAMGIIERLDSAVMGFSSEEPRDDIAVLVLRAKG